MITSPPKLASSDAAASAPPSSTHPAYWPLFAHYCEAGQSATRALALLAKGWDVDERGPLPSARTARHWAHVDAWDARDEAAVAAAVPAYRNYVEMRLLAACPGAVDSLLEVIHGRFTDPRVANATARAAFGVLARCGFGPPHRRRKTQGLPERTMPNLR